VLRLRAARPEATPVDARSRQPLTKDEGR
jgi:hypothetical protein